jgi:hypothetical protein
MINGIQVRRQVPEVGRLTGMRYTTFGDLDPEQCTCLAGNNMHSEQQIKNTTGTDGTAQYMATVARPPSQVNDKLASSIGLTRAQPLTAEMR